MTSLPVVVVGAGPTGSAAALGLAARGVRTIVLERWPDVYPQPRAVHLDDEVYRILSRLGIGDELARLTRPSRGLRFVDADLRVLAQLDRAGTSPVTGHPRANMFDQPELDTVLRRRLSASEEVTLTGGREVTAVEQVAPDRVLVRHRPSGSDDAAAEEVVEAAFVLGCDGANSLVRRTIGASMTDLGFEQRWLVMDVETDADLRQWDGVQQVCGSTRAATFMRVGEMRYRWELRLLDDEDAATYATLASVLPLLRPWLDGVDVDALRLVRSTEYTFRAAVADRWSRGRIFVLGDAAHVTPPFIGQGMGAGIRDADNLAWKVAGVVDGSLPASVLETYDAERSAHARTMVLLARTVGTVMCAGGQLGDRARRVLVPMLERVSPLRARIVDSATPPLVSSGLVPRARGDRLAGRLCPNVLDGVPCLDALVGPGWSFVTTTPPAPSSRAELARLGVVVVEVAPRSEPGAWLTDGRAVAALVRPDRTVAVSGADVTALVAAASALLCPARPASRTWADPYPRRAAHWQHQSIGGPS